ncbi:MAG: hypothetical protein ACKOGB_06145, partial [Betaproteobacteria bacterium]
MHTTRLAGAACATLVTDNTLAVTRLGAGAGTTGAGTAGLAAATGAGAAAGLIGTEPVATPTVGANNPPGTTPGEESGATT